MLSPGKRLQLVAWDVCLAVSAMAGAALLCGQCWPWRPEGAGWGFLALLALSWLVALHAHDPLWRVVYHSRLLGGLRAAYALGVATLAAVGVAQLMSPGLVGGWCWHLWSYALMVAGAVVSRVLLSRGRWWHLAAPAVAVLGIADERARELLRQMEQGRACRVVAWWSDGAPRDPEDWRQVTHLALLPQQHCAAALTAALDTARACGVQVSGLDCLYMDLMQRAPLLHPQDRCEESALVPLVTPPGRWLHRVNDLVMCLLMTPLAAVLCGLSAVLVKLTSAGPVFFTQQRAGLHERPITVYKIRTMHHHQGSQFAPTAECDPRVIPAAKILRRLRIDELPQLMCVLRGDMSLIGPRPESVERYQQFKSQIALFPWRKQCAPGITGWAQVNLGYGGEDADALPKLQYDLYYVHRQSPLLDLRIMLRTPFAILFSRDVR